MDVESQKTLDEAIDRATSNLQKLVGDALGTIVKEFASLIVGVQQERKELETFISGLTVEITVPKITIAVKSATKE